MLQAIKRLFEGESAAVPETGRLRVAVAALLHEVRRADYEEGGEESERKKR